MLRAGVIAGNPHLKEANPYLRLTESPFYLAAGTTAWKPSVDANGNSRPLLTGGKRSRHSDRIIAASMDRSVEPQELLEAWLNGAEVDWRQLHVGAAPRRAALPTYDFDRQRFWFTEKPKEVRLAAAAVAASGQNG